MDTVELIYFNAGGGHRAAALALQQVMSAQRRPWRVRLTNLTEVVDSQGLFQRLTGLQPEDLYNKRLASGFTLGLAQELKLLQGAIRVAHGGLVQRLRAHWVRSQPDMVVSLIPNFNRALCQSLDQARPGVPFVTVMTDMADHPPHFWAEPDLAQHLVCGTEHAVRQALAAGCAPERVHRVSGMVLRPDFYAPPVGCRRQARLAAGLPAEAPTGIVLFGGHGSRAMLRVAERLADVPLILLCGRNASLAQALRALPARAPRRVLEFTPDVAAEMRLADFFIGKPGPGSISEAVHMGLPVITTRNAWTMPQERWNTEWVREQGVGVVHRSLRSVRAAVAETLARLPELQVNVRRIDNQALMEVPALLSKLLPARSRREPEPAASPA
jgi:1,2-diacylglycerol 3-beta-galactosyltransferase